MHSYLIAVGGHGGPPRQTRDKLIVTSGHELKIKQNTRPRKVAARNTLSPTRRERRRIKKRISSENLSLFIWQTFKRIPVFRYCPIGSKKSPNGDQEVNKKKKDGRSLTSKNGPQLPTKQNLIRQSQFTIRMLIRFNAPI